MTGEEEEPLLAHAHKLKTKQADQKGDKCSKVSSYSIKMKCHQILTGAANRGDRTFAVGSVEGIPFTVSQ